MEALKDTARMEAFKDTTGIESHKDTAGIESPKATAIVVASASAASETTFTMVGTYVLSISKGCS